MLKIFLIIMGCVHLFAIGVIVGSSVSIRENKKNSEEFEKQLHDLAKAVFILNSEYKKLYQQVNKEDKNED